MVARPHPLLVLAMDPWPYTERACGRGGGVEVSYTGTDTGVTGTWVTHTLLRLGITGA